MRNSPNKEASPSNHLFNNPSNTTDASRSKGILPSQYIREYVKSGIVKSEIPIDEDQIQPASIDLRLGSVAYQVSASFLPGGYSSILSKIQALDIEKDKIDLTKSTVLQKGCVYIIPLQEELYLPSNVSAKANPKSTSGRLDIFVRLLTDFATGYEFIPSGYKGKLYAEVIPRTFSVIVKEGIKLNQLRFIRGGKFLSDSKLVSLDKTENIVYNHKNPLDANIANGLTITVTLDKKHGEDIVGFKALRNAPVIDVSKIDYYDPKLFWEPLAYNEKKCLTLFPDELYILTSNEKVRVPSPYAAEMVPYEPAMGEFRVHYAGFFDPGFGYGMDDVKGTPGVLEVRAHEAPFIIENGQMIAKLQYYSLLEIPDKIYGTSIGSSYQFQRLTLSKQFRR
jgi:dCTP deaminase